ncbi:MAG: hypothetical protein PHX62_01610 [Bacilli bacterium]|nr:hypothetical protein [Bacilli bacterium]
MHYDLIIICDYDPKNIFEEFNFLRLSPSSYLIGPYETNEEISFDYLIFSDPLALNNQAVLMDFEFIITNYYFQTSFEQYFCIGKANKSNLAIEKQFQRIKEYLINPS